MNLRDIVFFNSKDPFIEFEPEYIATEGRRPSESIPGYVFSVDQTLPPVRGYFIRRHLQLASDYPVFDVTKFVPTKLQLETIPGTEDSPPLRAIRGEVINGLQSVSANLVLDHIILERSLPNIRFRWENRWRFVPEYCLRSPPANLLTTHPFAEPNVVAMPAVVAESSTDDLVLYEGTSTSRLINMITGVAQWIFPMFTTTKDDLTIDTVSVERRLWEENLLRNKYEQARGIGSFPMMIGQPSRRPFWEEQSRARTSRIENMDIENDRSSYLSIELPLRLIIESATMAFSAIMAHRLFRNIFQL